MQRLKLIIKAFTLLVIASQSLQAQQVILGQDTTQRPITTAVPFMMIAPDARSGAMGDAGVALSADANAIHWNVARLAFIQNDIGFSLSHTPWLAKIINDMSISYLSGYYKINKEQSVGLALKYFDLGDMEFRDNIGELIQDFNPREFTLAGSYSRLLTEDMSLGVTLKYIYSNLTGNVYIGNDPSQAGVSVAADIGWYWNKDMNFISDNSNLALGAVISNIGNKITYTNDENRDFIPTNLRLGGAYTISLDPYNTLTLAMDFNKLLVPTPPVYLTDSTGNYVEDGNGGFVIANGRDPNRPLLSGIFGSFTDAPDGFSEEMQEISISTGLEYWYKDIFALRAGYFYENANKGDRKYLTMGLGLRYNVFGIDFAYLVPQKREHPLAETLRFTLHFNFNDQTQEASILDQNQ
jgi:hypothetical protein